MPDMMDVDPLKKYMVLFQSPSGGGKSIAIASFLELGSVYFFDFDGRMASVAQWAKRHWDLKSGQLTYDTYGPSNLYEAMQKMDGFIDNCPHAAIAVDSFTAVTIAAVSYSLRRRGLKGGTFSPTTTKGDMIVPDWDEYKGETVCVTQMLEFCKSIAARGVKVFWTAHPIVSTKIEQGKGEGGRDKYGKQTRYAAYGQKTDSLIPIYFDEIYNLANEYNFESERVTRWWFTQPNGDVNNTKTALILPYKMNITNKSFYRVLMENLGKERGADEPQKIDI